MFFVGRGSFCKAHIGEVMGFHFFEGAILLSHFHQQSGLNSRSASEGVVEGADRC